MESRPEDTETSLIGPDDEEEIKKVTICDVSLEETREDGGESRGFDGYNGRYLCLVSGQEAECDGGG
jgi:hypothetical protein